MESEDAQGGRGEGNERARREEMRQKQGEGTSGQGEEIRGVKGERRENEKKTRGRSNTGQMFRELLFKQEVAIKELFNSFIVESTVAAKLSKNVKVALFFPSNFFKQGGDAYNGDGP